MSQDSASSRVARVGAGLQELLQKHQTVEQLRALTKSVVTRDSEKVDLAVVVKSVLRSHSGVGEFTTQFRTYFSGNWDVHGCSLEVRAFDPWP